MTLTVTSSYRRMYDYHGPGMLHVGLVPTLYGQAIQFHGD